MTKYVGIGLILAEAAAWARSKTDRPAHQQLLVNYCVDRVTESVGSDPSVVLVNSAGGPEDDDSRDLRFRQYVDRTAISLN